MNSADRNKNEIYKHLICNRKKLKRHEKKLSQILFIHTFITIHWWHQFIQFLYSFLLFIFTSTVSRVFCSSFRDNSVLALHQFCGVIFHSFCLQTFFSLSTIIKTSRRIFALKNNLREEKKKIIFVLSYKKKKISKRKNKASRRKEKIPICGCYMFKFRMCLSSTTT